MRSRRRWFLAVGCEAVFLALFLGCAAGRVGIKAGPSIGGREDVRFSGTEIRGQSPEVGPAASVGFTAWHKGWGPSVGFGVDFVGIWNDLKVNGTKIEEERLGLLGAVLGRYPLPRLKDAYIYGGVTGGGFFARLKSGDRELDPAVGLRLGVSFPLLARLEFLLEGDCLFFADVNGRAADGSWLKVSGSGSPGDGLRGPHGDTTRCLAKAGVNLLVW